MKALGYLTCLLCCCLALNVARAAEQVVLDSNSPKYQPGVTFDTATVISLGTMEFLVLAADDGTLLRIEGPYMGLAEGSREAGSAPRQSSVRRAIERLLGMGPDDASALGGVRGGPEETPTSVDTRPGPWFLHAGQTGDQCVVEGAPVRVWREDARARGSAEITDVTSRRSGALEWPVEQASSDWPLESPPLDGRIYLVRPAGDLRSIAIRVHRLAAPLADKGLATVAWLAARGCVAQARILLRQESGTASR